MFSPLLSLVACQSADEPAPNALGHTQAVLDRIADRCRMPREVWKLRSEHQVTLQPSPDAPYEGVDCLLRELQKSKLPVRLGFVGNEAFSENVN